MVVFRSVVDALGFVLDFRSETGDDSIKIRAGIHVGPARIIDDDIYGMMVNYTKRVESHAEGPGITISEEAKRQIDYEKAARHSKLLFSRPCQVLFKGFDRPQTIYRIAIPRGARERPSFESQKCLGSDHECLSRANNQSQRRESHCVLD